MHVYRHKASVSIFPWWRTISVLEKAPVVCFNCWEMAGQVSFTDLKQQITPFTNASVVKRDIWYVPWKVPALGESCQRNISLTPVGLLISCVSIDQQIPIQFNSISIQTTPCLATVYFIRQTSVYVVQKIHIPVKWNGKITAVFYLVGL
jgi:hypothetical protein